MNAIGRSVPAAMPSVLDHLNASKFIVGPDGFSGRTSSSLHRLSMIDGVACFDTRRYGSRLFCSPFCGQTDRMSVAACRPHTDQTPRLSCRNRK